MAATVDQFVKKLSSEHQKILRFFRGLPEPIWEEQLYVDGEKWTVRDVMAHLVDQESSLYRLFSNISAGGHGVGADFDIDQHNAAEVKKLSGNSPAELLSMFDMRREKMLALVQDFSPEDLSKTGNHPYLGEATLEVMIRLFLVHTNLHIRDIKNTFGERLA